MKLSGNCDHHKEDYEQMVLSFTVNLNLVNLTPVTQGKSTLTFVQGYCYDYAVLCTDYCGSQIWDATNLDTD